VTVRADAPSRSRAAAHRAVTRSWASVHAWGSGRAFQNYADPYLEHWAAAYYGSNYSRLVRVKATTTRPTSSGSSSHYRQPLKERMSKTTRRSSAG
jgi:hypothetical protein